MDEKLRSLLAEEIKNEIETLGDLKQGSEEHVAATKAIVELYKTALEDIRTDTDAEEKWNRREMEIRKDQRDEAYREAQDKEQRINNYIRYGIDAAAIIVPLVFYGGWMRKGINFEKEGTFTSTVFKNFIGKIRPNKVG